MAGADFLYRIYTPITIDNVVQVKKKHGFSN